MQCVFATHLRGKRDKQEVLKVLLLFLPDTSRTSRIQNKDYNGVSAYIEFTVSTVYHNFYSMLYCAAPFVLDVYLCQEASQYYLFIYASTDQYMHFSVNVNRCLQNMYRYLRYIQLMTKTEFMANDKNMRVLITYNNCIKDDELLWGV